MATLAGNGEMRRAMRLLEPAQGVSDDPAPLPAIQDLFPPGHGSVGLGGASVPRADIDGIRERIQRRLSRPSRLRAPGLIFGRAEHWA
eukprot:14096861-Alexandrium_andersonii.AAC.1